MRCFFFVDDGTGISIVVDAACERFSLWGEEIAAAEDEEAMGDECIMGGDVDDFIRVSMSNDDGDLAIALVVVDVVVVVVVAAVVVVAHVVVVVDLAVATRCCGVNEMEVVTRGIPINFDLDPVWVVTAEEIVCC